MARSDADRQRDRRQRERANLYLCRAWIPGTAIEAAINAGLLSDADSHDELKRGEAVALVFGAWAEKIVTP